MYWKISEMTAIEFKILQNEIDKHIRREEQLKAKAKKSKSYRRNINDTI